MYSVHVHIPLIMIICSVVLHVHAHVCVLICTARVQYMPMLEDVYHCPRLFKFKVDLGILISNKLQLFDPTTAAVTE